MQCRTGRLHTQIPDKNLFWNMLQTDVHINMTKQSNKISCHLQQSPHYLERNSSPKELRRGQMNDPSTSSSKRFFFFFVSGLQGRSDKDKLTPKLQGFNHQLQEKKFRRVTS